MRRAGLEGAICVSDGAAGIIVEMGLDIAVNNASEHTNKLVDLAGRSTANGISDTDTVDANLVDSRVERKEVNKVRSEGIFRREADFDALGLDKVDDFDGSVADICHVLAVRVLTEIGRCADDDVAVWCSIAGLAEHSQ